MEHLAGRTADFGRGGQEHDGIQVPLDRPVMADLPPGFVQADPPVDADYVAAGLATTPAAAPDCRWQSE